MDKRLQDLLNNGAGNITEGDIKEVLDKRNKIENLFLKVGALKEFFENIQVIYSLIIDYYNGTYREIPYSSISAIVFALLYVIVPIDFLPDYIPLIGYLDDAKVVTICLGLIIQDINKYKEWKKQKV